jgi:hypothetical protein
MIRLARSIVLIAAVAAGGCAHRRPDTGPANRPRVDPTPVATVDSVELVEQVARDVFALRGLQQSSSLTVRRLAEQPFREALESLHSRYAGGAKGAPLSIDLSERAWTFERNDVIGFYDPFARSISVLDQPLTNARDELKRRILLAHEIEHAVQHQYFSLQTEAGQDLDGVLTRSAVLEGEASFVAEAAGLKASLLARRSTISFSRAMDLFVQKDPGGKMAGLMRLAANGTPDPVHRAVSLLSAFRYGDGLKFVESLYRQGGFAAIDPMLTPRPFPLLRCFILRSILPASARSPFEHRRHFPLGTRPRQARPSGSLASGWFSPTAWPRSKPAIALLAGAVIA